MKNTKSIKVLGAATLAMAALAPTMVMAAENDTTADHKATVELERGEFTLKTSETEGFGTHKIESKAKTVATGFAGDFGVIDARGTQEGYQVTVSASPFTIVEPAAGFAAGTGAYSLPAGSLSLGALTGIAGLNGEPTEVHPAAAALGAAIDMGEELLVTSADAGKGMGEYALTFGEDALSLVIDPLTAKIDKVNYADTVTPYESTITWNLVSGPTAQVEEEKEMIEFSGGGEFPSYGGETNGAPVPPNDFEIIGE